MQSLRPNQVPTYTLTDMSRSRIQLPTVAMFAALSLIFTGCATTPAPIDRPAKEENFQEPEAPPEYFPEGTAAENLPYFQEVLRQYAIGEAPVQGAPIVDHLTAAGFVKTNMEVSFDESKTNLVADSIFVSVLFGQECLIGQMVVSDRTFVTEVVPGLGPEKIVCLLGTTRPIDW